MSDRKYIFFTIIFVVLTLLICFTDNSNTFDKDLWEKVKIKNNVEENLKLNFLNNSYEIIIEKNLFHPKRIFHKEKKNSPNKEVSKIEVGEFNVVGLFIFGDEKFVTIANKNEKSEKGYFVGDRIEGSSYKVSEITSKKVVLMNDKEGEMTLRVE